MTRKEKEQLYIQKMTELQTWWGNPVDGDWDFIETWTDEKLDSGLKETIGQLRFEKSGSIIKKVFFVGLYIFVALGVIGLLLFGIRQLF